MWISGWVSFLEIPPPWGCTPHLENHNFFYNFIPSSRIKVGVFRWVRRYREGDLKINLFPVGSPGVRGFFTRGGFFWGDISWCITLLCSKNIAKLNQQINSDKIVGHISMVDRDKPLRNCRSMYCSKFELICSLSFVSLLFQKTLKKSPPPRWGDFWWVPVPEGGFTKLIHFRSASFITTGRENPPPPRDLPPPKNYPLW